MAYRRRQGIQRSSTFEDRSPPAPDNDSFSSSPSSLAAQAIRASAAFRNTSGDSASKDFTASGSKPKGFWGVLAEKAKAIIEEDANQQIGTHSGMLNTASGDQFYMTYQAPEKKLDNPRLRKGLDALTSSLNQIGDTLGNALEEGRTIVENKTADIIHETCKLQIRRKGGEQSQVPGVNDQWQHPTIQSRQMQANRETQLKASRDVAMATAAKAKLLLRELKTVKAELAFANQRCSQLDEENKILREAREKGVNPEDENMIRLQLETLLAEKARLAHENSIYASENRFLKEIVEYHQLTMQDVVYLDEGIEEVTEVYPIPVVSRMLSASPPSSPSSPRSLPLDILASPPQDQKTIMVTDQPQATMDSPRDDLGIDSTEQDPTRKLHGASS